MKTRTMHAARLVPLLILAGIVAACQQVTPTADAPTRTPAQPPAEPQASCYDSAITLLDRGGADIHGAIVADTLHMGGATAPATCSVPVNQSLAGLPDDRAAQAQQSRYYLIVIRYPGGNRLYVLSRRADGTSCVVDTNDECIARVTDLPDDFDLEELPDDVAPIIPAGRPAPPTAGPSPGDDETPPTAGPAPGDDTPPPAAGTAPGAASSPQPSDAATGVTVGGPLLSWAAAPRASSYDVYWAAENTDLDTPINTSLTTLRISASADLDADTLYYWRVDAKNEAGTTRGAVWSFTTEPAPAPPAPAPAPPAPEPQSKSKNWTLSRTDHFGDIGRDILRETENRTTPFVWDEITEANRVCTLVWVTRGHQTPFTHSRSAPKFGFGNAGGTWTVTAEVSVGAITLVLTAPNQRTCIPLEDGRSGSRCWGTSRSSNLMSGRRALDGKVVYATILTPAEPRCVAARGADRALD